jgi:hypothetical protein
MKRRIISVIIYAASFLALAIYFDALYRAGPVTHYYLSLIRLAVCGTVLLAFVCVSSRFNFRVGVISGLGAGVLALRYFAIQAIAVPWSCLWSVLPYANWLHSVTAILVSASSTYSLMYALSAGQRRTTNDYFSDVY